MNVALKGKKLRKEHINWAATQVKGDRNQWTRFIQISILKYTECNKVRCYSFWIKRYSLSWISIQIFKWISIQRNRYSDPSLQELWLEGLAASSWVERQDLFWSVQYEDDREFVGLRLFLKSVFAIFLTWVEEHVEFWGFGRNCLWLKSTGFEHIRIVWWRFVVNNHPEAACFRQETFRGFGGFKVQSIELSLLDVCNCRT